MKPIILKIDDNETHYRIFLFLSNDKVKMPFSKPNFLFYSFTPTYVVKTDLTYLTPHDKIRFLIYGKPDQ